MFSSGAGLLQGRGAGRIQARVRNVRKVTDGLAQRLFPGLFCALVLYLPGALEVCAQQSPPSSSHAEQIFEMRCAKCHGEHGQGRSGVISIAGPNIQAEHDKGQVLTAMYTGPSHMPVFSYVLSTKDADSVADYVVQKLAIIPLKKGDLGEGGKLFREHCAVCHRTAVRGGALVFTGVNAPNLVDKSPAIIAGAIRWGPGPMPRFPPSILDDDQVSSIVSYVRYVQHPPTPGGSPMKFIGPVAEGCIAWIIVFLLILATTWIEKGGKG